MWPLLRRAYRSLYARIVFIYLASMIALSAATALIAVDQFDQLGREWLQRSQINMARQLAQTLRAPLSQGLDNDRVHAAIQQIMTINPSLSLYVLDENGSVVGAYSEGSCGLGEQVDRGAIAELLSEMPMLPVYADMPCQDGEGVFSVAPVTFGPEATPGYLFVRLEANTQVSMSNIWETSGITRTLLISTGVALLLTLVVGLALFALLTRRFTRVTRAVRHFARGDYRQRVPDRIDDEIGRVGRAFNEMAATIEAQVEALRDNDRQRRELVANLSHEFRTPLTSLSGYTRQLLRTATSADSRESLEAIRLNVDRLTRLATQLSQMSHANISDRALSLESFSFAELANDIVSKFRPRAEENGIFLAVENEADMAQVAADVELIDHALTNLVDNALFATNAGGRVTIRILHLNADTLKIGVRDTGIGMKPEEIALVCQRFYRTAHGRERGDGTGLGLAIVSDVLKRHDSKLTLESKPGRGSCIWFTLPLAKP